MSAPATAAVPKKKGFSFPTAFTVLFIVLLLAAGLTWLVPAGQYSRLEYMPDEKTFTRTTPLGESDVLPGTQETLKANNINLPIEKFENKDIKKPMAIPGTYQEIEKTPQGLWDIVKAPVQGIADSIDIIVFVLILGGLIGLMNKTGAFNAGIGALSRATKGREFLLIIILTVLIALGGTTFGMAEETIALYPMLIPIFLAAGYDALVCIAAIYMGSSIGTMFSTTNPFSTAIASNAAGISFTDGMPWRIIGLVLATILTLWYIIRYANRVKKDPSRSLMAADKEEVEARFLKGYDPDSVPPFNWRRILLLVMFFGGFLVMIYGVINWDWWFVEMSGLFLAISILSMILSGLSEKDCVYTFVEGAADLVSVALIIGVARGINLIMDAGNISDTLLYSSSNLVQGMNGGIFSVVMMLVFSILGFFIPSSSGLAVLSMPIMAPLADTIGVARSVVVSAYNLGQGWMAFITPTGLILATLQMADITFDKWLKFILPLMGIIGVLAAVLLAIQTYLPL